MEMNMNNPHATASDAFQTFATEAQEHFKALMGMAQGFEKASALDKKTESLAYLAVLAALRMESGVPFHTGLAKKAGASRDEVKSAILVGMPAAGLAVTQCLPAALAAYDASNRHASSVPRSPHPFSIAA